MVGLRDMIEIVKLFIILIKHYLTEMDEIKLECSEQNLSTIFGRD